MGWAVPDLEQVRGALAITLLSRGLVHRVSPGRWEPSDFGYRMFDVWVPDGEPDESVPEDAGARP
jgi:hypothetical protein